MKYVIEMPKNKKIENEDLIEDLKKVYEIIGKAATINEYNSYGKYETSSFIRRFGLVIIWVIYSIINVSYVSIPFCCVITLE